MKTLPASVQAQLIVASKLSGGARHREINRIIDEAKIYYPWCFKETENNRPKPRRIPQYEMYINSLKHPELYKLIFIP